MYNCAVKRNPDLLLPLRKLINYITIVVEVQR